MEKGLLLIGRAAGAAGAVLSTVSVGARVSGQYFLGGIHVGTLLLGGVAAMVLGCLCFLAVLTARSRNGP